ncbi:MAG: ATP-binding protein [Microbacteriaceae bacterium]
MFKNPYRPGAAVTPIYLAGREGQEKRFRAVLRSAPELPANLRMTGLRGVGKTVLLKRFEDIAAKDLGWATQRVQLEPRHNREEELVTLVAKLASAAASQLSRRRRFENSTAAIVESARSLLTVQIEDFTLSLAGLEGERQEELVGTLLDVTNVALKSGKVGFLLLLDEAQVLVDDKDRDGEHPLSLLVAAVNTLQEKEVPIGLVLCGLPTLKSNLLKARTYSERMFRGEEVGSLSRDEAQDAFLKPLEGTARSATPSLVNAVLKDVQGYPYFIQLWGAELWDEADAGDVDELTADLLESIKDSIYHRLDEDFYDTRVESLTPAEQDILLLTADCDYPPLKTADIHQVSNRSEGNANVLMGRLAEQGVVFRIQKGQYHYTAPQFHEYLKRRRSKSTW